MSKVKIKVQIGRHFDTLDYWIGDDKSIWLWGLTPRDRKKWGIPNMTRGECHEVELIIGKWS